jgi:5-methylcytosine-specific restriction endonuclease McrA
MKEEILKLRSEGKSYNEIVKILNCSKGTISYHCGIGQKTKSLNRLRKNRKQNNLKYRIQKFSSIKIPTKVKISAKKFNFKRSLYRKLYDFFNASPNLLSDKEVFLEKMNSNPYCYLTGRKIDLTDTPSYNFDHIIPVCKGGSNSFDNLGLTCKDANHSKSYLTVEEYLSLCKEVLEHNGYTITKNI